MTGRLAAVLLITCAASLGAADQSRQLVNSARLTLLREQTKDVVLSVTNLRDVSLEYFEVELPSAGTIFWTASEMPYSTSPPIGPSVTYKVVIADRPGYSPAGRPIVRLVEYADGYYDGSDEAIRKLFAQRAVAAEDLKYWIDELRLMPETLSNRDAVDYVRRADERQREQRPAPPSETVGRLSGLGAVPRPTGWVSQFLRAEIPRLESDLRRATRHLERAAAFGAAKAPVQPTSVRVSAELVPGIRLVPVVENLRDVPLEAWSISEFLSASHYAGVTTDTCSARPAAPGVGAIQPGESRRLPPLASYPPDKVDSVTITLGIAHFRDGYSEGDRNELQQVLERRKARGIQCAR